MIAGSEMAVVDANAAALGVPRKQLMESSGNATARVARTLVDEGDSITIVAGRGNNGGDAFVAARFLEGFDVDVLLLGRAETIGTEIARENWAALEPADCRREEIRDSSGVDLGDPDLIVDAMLGTGVTGSLREPEATAAAAINDSDATVLSVDVPSGFNAESGTYPDDAVQADHVVTFHETKPGLPDLDVPVTVADIGIPEAASEFVERGDLLRLSRDPDSHKGDHGEVLVIGGGPYVGAPALAGQAALRAGADLVRVACPTAVAHEVQGYSEDLIVRPVEGREFEPGHVGQVMEFAAEHDTLVIGPGLGDSESTLEAAEAILTAFTGTAVVDADALELVPDIETEATLICTPHQGELAKMGGPSAEDWRERRDAVEEFAAELGHTLLVKGNRDIVSDGDRTRVNRTGNPGMTVGGTGDILAGTTGALAARQEPIHAAGLAAYVAGRAGDIVAEQHGDGLIASDLLEATPAAMQYDE
ncbi:NAD(P)H-hydrate dehydratase [Halovenus sp. WSH3]|uniref:Bifunctional NAD(P)H-hydrate repair enzyme n=1 Tax=Halovenus carboxidivorans TaxID=2692199 RepID=A0A6B0T5C8_9EURY|nr:NAD(P)H-hydrate dehydratase [Halovenus carboxidivorans]MXR52157.1 NAD(P)H-hydrate dehydratase [Halovenus carboxidivorans]